MDLLSFGGSVCHGYMCILVYVKLIGCNGFAWIYAWLGIHLPWVYVHSAICETYGVWWCSMDLLSFGGSICHVYMCILLYVRLMGCNSVAWIYCHLGVCLPWVYVHSAICEMYWVLMVLLGSMLNWGVHLPSVYMHSVICETWGVTV